MNPAEPQPEGGWIVMDKARLQAPPPAARGLMFRTVSRASRFFGRAQIPDIFATFHINARLFWAWLFFASRLMPGGQLPAREREKIILRTAWNCRSRYEWGQHVDIALRVGVPDADIVRVMQGPAAFEGERERALISACDELARGVAVSDATWATLSAHYGPALMIEIVILIGHYVMVAGFLNVSGIALEPPTEKKLQDFYNRIDQA